MDKLISLKNVSFSYSSEKNILKNLCADFYLGERVCLKGESGKGKTTLLRLLCAFEKQTVGEIEFHTQKRKIAYVSQDDDLLPWYTALKNVSLVSDEETARKYLKMFFLQESENKYPSQLSGGMKKRVALAKALAYDADILLLDESFNGLDNELKEKIMTSVINETKNKLVLFTSHNENEIEFFATRVLELDKC